MKYKIVLVIGMMSSLLYSNQSDQVDINQHNQPTQHLTTSIGISNNNQPIIDITISPNNQIMVDIGASINKVINNVQNNIRQRFEFIKHDALDIYSSCTHYTQQHSIRIAAGACLLGYTALCSTLFFFSHKLNQPNTWGSWKEQYSLEILQGLPQKELAKELIVTIQHKYQTPQTLHDFMMPLISFLIDVNQEIRSYEHFIKIHVWIDTFKLSALFPAQKDLLQKAPKRIERLLFIKNLLLQWVIEYKMAVRTV